MILRTMPHSMSLQVVVCLFCRAEKSKGVEDLFSTKVPLFHTISLHSSSESTKKMSVETQEEHLVLRRLTLEGDHLI